MSGVRVLVGTRKGAFVLTSDGKREVWDIKGPFFGGWRSITSRVLLLTATGSSRRSQRDGSGS